MASNVEAFAGVDPRGSDYVTPAEEKAVLASEQQVAPVQTKTNHFVQRADDWDEHQQGEWPTEEEFHTLRRVADKIPWKVYTLAFVELCERFSYYGTTVVCE